MCEEKVTFEFIGGDSEDKCVDFCIYFNADLGTFSLLFSCELEELKNFAKSVLRDGPCETLHGSGSGCGYCNIHDKGDDKIEIECDPGHCCKTYFMFDKNLLVEFANAVNDL